MTMRHVGWATQEFRRANVGDERRKKRLIRVAATTATRPAGRITQVFRTSAEREAAYRLLQNDAISSTELSRASCQATANRCFGEEFVVVPIDETSLSLRDRCDAKGLGIINTTVGARGLHVMSAIAVRRNGTPLGLCGQQFWVRRDRVGLKRHDYDIRDVEK